MNENFIESVIEEWRIEFPQLYGKIIPNNKIDQKSADNANFLMEYTAKKQEDFLREKLIEAKEKYEEDLTVVKY